MKRHLRVVQSPRWETLNGRKCEKLNSSFKFRFFMFSKRLPTKTVRRFLDILRHLSEFQSPTFGRHEQTKQELLTVDYSVVPRFINT
jgi:hypothetical protein